MEDKGILSIKEMYDKLGIKNMIDKFVQDGLIKR